MIGVVVAAHGDLASALVGTARSVVQLDAHVEAVAIRQDDDTASYGARLNEAVHHVDGHGGVLILTDMFGGTPSNVGLTLHREGEVEVLTGANLPMLIKALQLSTSEMDLATVAKRVKESGQRAIAIASEVLGIDSIKEHSA